MTLQKVSVISFPHSFRSTLFKTRNNELLYKLVNVLQGPHAGKSYKRTQLQYIDVTELMLYFLATGKNDWQWLYDCVVTSLRKLHDDGFQVVLFTNQAGIEKMKVKPEDLMEKIDAIVMELEIPCFVSLYFH